MLHIGVVVLAGYFCLTSVWWLLQTTMRYYHCLQRHVDFSTAITFPCCASCRTTPIDGIVKMVFAGLAAMVEFAMDKSYQGDAVFLSRVEVGTLFTLVVFCGAMDVLALWGSKTFYRQIDYAGLALLFASTGVILEMRAYSTAQPVASLHALSAYVAFGGVAVVVAEAVYSHHVLCPVIRSFFLLLQGTWWLHISALLQQDVHAGTGTSTTSDTIKFFSVLFAAHVAVDLAIIVCLWLLVSKLVEKNCCCCVGLELGPSQNEGVFLENRVHFDYHVLTRLDSQSDGE